MTEVGASPKRTRLTLPTLLIGPRSQGRNYDILRRSPGPPLSRDAQTMLTDFTLSLAGWADRRLDRFVAFFPLSSGDGLRAMARGRFLGEASHGTIAVASVILVDAEALKVLGGAPHQLLSALPDPESSAAGNEPLVVEVSAERPRGDDRLSRLSVGWRDRILDVGVEDAEAVLVEALDAIEPPAQRTRITGWASTASLPYVGRFVPAEVFQLITHATDDRGTVADIPHLPMSLAGGHLVGEDVAAPPARQAWERVKALDGPPAMCAALAGLTWSARSADIAAADMVAIAAVDVCLKLDPANQAALLVALARKATDRHDPLSNDLRAGLQRAFAGLLSAAPSAAAGYVMDYMRAGSAAPAVIEQAYPVLRSAVSHIAVLRHLDGPTITSLCQGGLLDDFAADATLDALGQLASDRALTLLKQALLRAVDRREHWGLACRLTLRLLREKKLGRAGALGVVAVLEQLVRRSPDPVDQELADVEVVRLAHAETPRLFPALIQRVISPALAAPQSSARFVAALAAALLTLKLGRPSP